MMPRALFLLIRFNFYGQLRRDLLRLKRPRQVIYSLLGLVSVLLMLAVPWILFHVLQLNKSMGAAAANGPGLGALQTGMSMMLLVNLIWNLANPRNDAILQFNPSEIDFVVSGPFSRRELLLYRILSSALNLWLVALLYATWLLPFSANWVMTYLGMFLAVLFTFLLTMASSLARMTVLGQAYTRARKFILLLVIALFAAAIWKPLLKGGSGGWVEAINLFRSSWAGTCLVAPFRVFSGLMAGREWFPDLLLWGGASVLLNLALFGVILLLDAAHQKTLLTGGQRIIEQMQKSFQSQAVPAASRTARDPWRPASLGYYGGAGPIAWRHLLASFRITRQHPWGACLWLLGIGFSVFITVTASRADPNVYPLVMRVAPFGLGLYCVAAGGISGFPFDFRADIYHIDSLKMLPSRPGAVIAGELFIPLLVTTGGAILFVAAVIAWAPLLRDQVWMLAPLAIPLNVFLVGYENLATLLFPLRGGTVALQDQMRNLVVIFMKYILLLFVFGVVLAGGLLLYLVSGKSWLVFKLTVGALLILAAISLMYVLGWTFKSFDPSQDVPSL